MATKKELKKKIARLESENERLRNDIGHWTWVKHHMEQFVVDKSNQHSVRTEPDGGQPFPPYTISYIDDNGKTRNALIVEDTIKRIDKETRVVTNGSVSGTKP